MSAKVSVPEGVEAWKNCNAGLVYVRVPLSGGREQIRKIKGGEVLRVTAEVRQMIQEAFSRPERDIFVNGTMKRVDNRIAEAPAEPSADEIVGVDSEAPEVQEGKTSLPDGYDPERAVDDDDLVEIIGKFGTAFHAAVKKLSEGRARRLKALMASEEHVDNVKVSQVKWLDTYLAETFPHGKSSKTYLEMQSDTPRKG